MPRTYRGDRKQAIISNGGVAVSAIATAFGVASTTDFPVGPITFEVAATGESLVVTAGLGTTSWSGISRGMNHTTAAVIPDGSVLLEIDGANDKNNNIQRDETALPTSLLSSTTPIVDGVGAVGVSTKAARADHVHPLVTSFAAEITATDLKVTGLTGSVTASRYVGMTPSGAPSTGPHLVGDWILSLADAKVYVCTVAGTPGTFVTAGGGTVTSVGLSLPAELSVSGSPVTGSGTLTAAWATETANRVLAGPTTGSPGTPAFRALVAADIPALTLASDADVAISSPANLDLLQYSTSDSKWHNVPIGSSSTITLGSNYTLAAGSAAEIILSLSLGAGTYLVSGSAEVQNPATANWAAGLYDGTTDYGLVYTNQTAGGVRIALTTSTVPITLASSGTISLRTACSTSGGVVQASATFWGFTGSGATLTATRIA